MVFTRFNELSQRIRSRFRNVCVFNFQLVVFLDVRIDEPLLATTEHEERNTKTLRRQRKKPEKITTHEQRRDDMYLIISRVRVSRATNAGESEWL